MLKFDVVQDLFKLTNIQQSILQSIFDKIAMLLANYIVEANKYREDTILADIYFGKICIYLNEETIKITFQPSDKLDLYMKDAALNNKSILIQQMEKSLANKILNIYKDLL